MLGGRNRRRVRGKNRETAKSRIHQEKRAERSYALEKQPPLIANKLLTMEYLLENTTPRFTLSLNLPRNTFTTPSKTVLDQLCFVVPTSSLYFPIAYQLLESLQLTSLYKNIPINIIDVGLSLGEKQLLQKHFPIAKILNPASILSEIYSMVRGQEQDILSLASRPHIPEIFPGYRYYFLLDPDLWIQDERSLDSFVNLSLEYGLGIAKVKNYIFDHSCYGYSFLDSLEKEYVKKWYWCNGGVWCIDSHSDIFQIYKHSFIASLQRNPNEWLGVLEQNSLNVAGSKANVKTTLNYLNNFCLGVDNNLSLVRAKNKLLYVNDRRLIGIFHFAAFRSKLDQSNFDILIPDCDSAQPVRTSLHFRKKR